MGPFVSYEENEEFWIRPLEYVLRAEHLRLDYSCIDSALKNALTYHIVVLTDTAKRFIEQALDVLFKKIF